jgi:large subunit ribosomal protein L4
MKASIFTTEGKKDGDITLPEAVFGVAWNADVVHEVVTGMQSNARTGIAHTKDRGEVRGGGKKPWKQKGTGRARHGSRRSPIWVGGGVAHGPRNEKDYTKKINKKVRQKALAITLSKKFSDGEVFFIENFSFKAPKTTDAKVAMANLAKAAAEDMLIKKRKNAALIVLSERNEMAEKSFRNFGNYEVVMAKDVNPVDLLTYKYVVVADPEASIALLEKRVA